jgi:hypothetical protein
MAMTNTRCTVVPCAVVDQVAEELRGLSRERDVVRRANRFIRAQPALAAYTLASIEEMPVAAGESIFWHCFAVWTIFQRAFGDAIPELQPEQVTAAENEVTRELERVAPMHNRLLERRLLSGPLSGQPFVMRYLVQALFEEFEEGDEADQIRQGEAFLVLLSVLQALDHAVRNPAPRRARRLCDEALPVEPPRRRR